MLHNKFLSKNKQNKTKLVLNPCSVNILKGGVREIHNYATALASIFPVIEVNESCHPMSKRLQRDENCVETHRKNKHCCHSLETKGKKTIHDQMEY